MRKNDAARTSGRPGGARFVVRLVVAGLVAGGLAGARPAWSQTTVASSRAGAVDVQPGPSTVPRRAFEHRFHERVACTRCHGTGAQHRTIRVRAPTDCAGCHHDPRLEKSCVECHAPERLPMNTRITVAMVLTVRDSSAARDLPFGHDRHEALACRDCHGTPVTLDRDRQCSSCHDRHHGAEATCSSCHAGALRPKHRASAHLSCDGGGCHAPSVAPSPVLSRNECLLCHPERRTHEPNGNCATCHEIPAAAAARRATANAHAPEGAR